MPCRVEWDFNLKILYSWEDTAQLKAYVGKAGVSVFSYHHDSFSSLISFILTLRLMNDKYHQNFKLLIESEQLYWPTLVVFS